MFGSTAAFLATIAAFARSMPLTADLWKSPDDEIGALPFTVARAESGPKIDGWIRTRYANSGDVDANGASSEQELGGFNLDNARLRVGGEAAPGWSYTVSVKAGDSAVSDASGTGVALLDAYAGVRLGDWGSLSVGRFSTTVFWNAGVEERRLLFLDRSFLDEAWDGRDVGFELFVEYSAWCGWVAAQNGVDGAGDDLALSARASFHVLGGALYGSEGAQGLGDGEEHLTLGAGWFDDTSFDEGTAIVGDVVYAAERWSAVLEIADFGDDIRPSPAINSATGVLIPSTSAATGAETPWGVTVGYLLVPDAWEVGLRWQDYDDDAETTGLAAVVNRYIAGHDVKWTLQVDSTDSDVSALEATTIALGLTVGF